MSVDTNTKGKNLGAYRKLRHDGASIHITPQLVGMAESMRIVTGGGLGRKLKVEFRAAPGAAGGDCC
ncbi:MAG: hypothetical protein AAF945_01350 [Actinomycetota bacterium]